MIPISAKDEYIIDKIKADGKGYFNVVVDRVFPINYNIGTKHILLYGRVDFNNDDDIDYFYNYYTSLIDDNIFNCKNKIYSNVDLNTGIVTKKDGYFKKYDTWDFIKWIKYNYMLIGKPSRILIYKAK